MIPAAVSAVQRTLIGAGIMAKCLFLLIIVGCMLVCNPLAHAQTSLPAQSQSNVGDVVIPTQEVLDLQELITPAATQGACSYVSYMGINFGCWSPDGNPFAYYYVKMFLVGDPITWNHYAWYRDYKGRAVSCPLNSRVYSMAYCGWPD